MYRVECGVVGFGGRSCVCFGVGSGLGVLVFGRDGKVRRDFWVYCDGLVWIFYNVGLRLFIDNGVFCL